MNTKRRVPAGPLTVLFAVVLLTGQICRSGPELNDPPEGGARDEAVVDGAKRVKEITIRNLTREEVRYTLESSSGAGREETFVIRYQEVDRHPADQSVDIYFNREDEELSYTLSPGVSYTFRYNEDGWLELYEGAHGRTDAEDLAPYVPTAWEVVDRMLELAEVDGDDILYDLGCGDGRIVIAAAKNYGAHGVGIDIIPKRIEESVANAREAGVTDLVEFRLEDATKADFSSATVVTLYLLTESNALLRPELERQLRPGTIVVSHNYHIPGWEDKEVGHDSLEDEYEIQHEIYVYKR